MKLENIKTIGDLKAYLAGHPSPVVADIILGAIRFFGVNCRKENGQKDWKAIKIRKKLGLGFKLTEDTEINISVVRALRNWALHPSYGRKLGTSFLDAMTSYASGGIGDPRKEVHRIFDALNGAKSKSPERGRKMLQTIDWFVLGKFEKFAHWWQRLTGKDCFWLAKLCLVLLLTGFAADHLIKIWLLNAGAPRISSLAIDALIAILWYHHILSSQTNAYKKIGFSNRNKLEFKIVRLFVMIGNSLTMPLIVFELIKSADAMHFFRHLIYAIIAIALVSMVYFAACDPLPPAKSKVKQWLEKAVSAVKNALSPAPQPQPIPVESRFS